MSTSRNAATFGRILALLLLAGWVAPVGSQEARIQLGTPISEDQLSGFDLIAAPDGSGMPPGAGTARQGREVYELNCLRCHNVNGEGVSGNTVIVGGDMRSEESPLRTVAVSGHMPAPCSISSAGPCRPICPRPLPTKRHTR